MADETGLSHDIEAVLAEGRLILGDANVSMAAADKVNLSVGPEVVGDGEEGDGKSESVSDESISNCRDVDVFEYEMELARICSGKTNEW